MTRVVTTGLVALLVLVAGCGGGVPGGSGGSDGGDGDGGTVNFYISDQQNAIDDFEHLNVTVKTVGLHRVNDTSEGTAEDGENETEDGEWLTYEAGNATYDLTKLQGTNASRVGELPVPNGTYTQVYIQVTDIEGTLKSGEEVDVKLPSNKLRVNSQFTVGNGETIDFVFDVTVFETGNGRYILKPVASESGAGKEVRENPGAKRGGQGNQGGERAQGGEGDSQGQGQVDFYVSDEKNAIGDFEHLNVTITKVGLHKASDGGGEESEEREETESESESEENETETESDEEDEQSESENETENETETESAEETESASESEAESEEERESETEDGERAGWVEQEVDSATLDLTELQGANASQISELEAPAGTYDKVFVYVSDIDGTLKNGEQVNVKLPSNKLQMNKKFTVSANETVEFVYDISVFKAGNSGKYILKPVVSESGTSDEVDIRKRGGDEEREDEEEREEAERLNATFTTDVVAGENATIEVTHQGSAVANATVEVNGETVGQTGADGTLTFTVPSDAEEVEVEVTKGDMEAELTRELSGNETMDGSESSEQSTAAA